jgi:hypothetical protein
MLTVFAIRCSGTWQTIYTSWALLSLKREVGAAVQVVKGIDTLTHTVTHSHENIKPHTGLAVCCHEDGGQIRV